MLSLYDGTLAEVEVEVQKLLESQAAIKNLLNAHASALMRHKARIEELEAEVAELKDRLNA